MLRNKNSSYCQVETHFHSEMVISLSSSLLGVSEYPIALSKPAVL